MNRKEKIDILNLEVKEISDLLSGMSELSDADRIPKVIVEMAHAKAIRVLTGITELKSRMESGSAQVSETLSGRSESVSHPSSTPASSEPSASPTEESVKRGNEQPSSHRGGGTTTPTTHSEPNSKPHVIFVSKRQLEEQATESRTIENVTVETVETPICHEAVLTESIEEKRVVVETETETICPTAEENIVETVPAEPKEEEPITETVAGSVVAEPVASEEESETKEISVENEEVVSKETTPTQAPTQEKPLPRIASIFDKVFQKHPETATRSVKHETDIRKLLTLNDRFLFQRELFKGDIGMLNFVLDELNKLPNYDDATKFLKERFDFDPEATGVAEFTALIEKYYQSK